MLRLQSTYSGFSLVIHAIVLWSITSTLPAAHVDVHQWQHLVGLQLADPDFGTPGGIDVLIGSDVWGLIIKDGVISGNSNEPHAQQTEFGWVVFGPVSTTPVTTLHPHTFHTKMCEDDGRLEDLLLRFWKLEEVSDEDVADNDCERIFSTTHSRTRDGRYIVHIPFRQDAPQLGDSYQQALHQFHSLERRLSANEDLRVKYVEFLREYTALGHMEVIDQPGDQTSPNCYYMPHHAVTDKFRVVFNASAKTSTGVSLNDLQLVGPTIQDTLLNIIHRFRRFRIALTADVEKMFRQVLVTPKHRDYQRILWRESPEAPISIFRLTTVTYGMACSPYNAVRVLHQCAYDNFGAVVNNEQALAARDTILKAFYVDDLLTSCNSIDEAVLLANNVDKILSAGHFKLRKWNSNNQQVIDRITGGTFLNEELVIRSPTASVLGLRWDPDTDEFFFNLALDPYPKTPTKRRVLSEVARLFDPTGLLAPVVITGKVFIQTLWSKGITWDAPLAPDLCDAWMKFRNGLDAINNFRVLRWLGMENGETTTLHGFCDASLRAYAAVIYAKTIGLDKQARVSLLAARTKVAPIKGATIPRLELCAALLLVSMLQSVRMALELIDTPYYLWSDSSIVLCWIRKQSSTLKPYVANRVSQIQKLTSADRWHHVRSTQNPADCASRGIGVEELLEHKLWLSGPKWLLGNEIPLETSMPLSQMELDAVNGEERASLKVMFTSVVPELKTRRRDGEDILLTERFSSLQRLLRTMVYILRWIPQRRHLRHQIISADELETALISLIKIEQSKAFGADIHQLQQNSNLPNGSRLLPLNPYLDDNSILRVGGRLCKAAVPHDHRFPIILPRDAAFVWLLIKDTHDRTLHGGIQLMLQTLRSRYWILNARQSIRSYVHNCVICRRHRGTVINQQMASLPTHRVNAGRPFIASGVDYCGPFTLRIGGKRSRTMVKTYLALFICMATKAVHLEVVDDLSSQAFLDAYTRFVGRRGHCQHLYSDNGTAFVGAHRLLQADLAIWRSEQIQQSLAHMGTNWHFISPRSPHQGGLWEAAIKSAKRHLVRLVGAQTLWYNQLQTLAVRIEACLNSRPLVPLHDDPEEKFALTPGDFLIGAPLIAVPEPSVVGVPTNRVKHWQWLRQLHQHFWQRWSDEYLSTLQTRNKWQRRKTEIQVGDIVAVRHENLPPTHWRLGRIIEVHPGSDGLVRNATLKTSKGTCTRAVQKLCRILEPLQKDDIPDCFEPSGSTGQDVTDSEAPCLQASD